MEEKENIETIENQNTENTEEQIVSEVKEEAAVESLDETQEVQEQEVVSADEAIVEDAGEVQTEESTEDVEDEKSQQEKKSKPKKEKKIKSEKVKKEKPAKKTKAEIKAEKDAAREKEFEGLSDDEIYAKIQTEKLLRKKKKSKIVTFVSLCFAFVVAVSVIVMAAVPINLKPACIGEGYTRVSIYPGTATNWLAFEEGSEGFKEFNKVYNKAFSQPYISALFSGTLSSSKPEETLTKFKDPKDFISNNAYIVHLEFDEDQVLTKSNGSKFVSGLKTDRWTYSDLTFRECYFQISQEEGLKDIVVYVNINNYPTFDNDGNVSGVDTTKSLVKITIKGNTKTIFDAYETLKELA